MNKTVRIALAAVATLSVGATACADKDDPVAEAAEEAERREADAGDGREAEAEAEAAPTEGGDAGTMPDVVCLDLQSAQDTIQAETDLFWSDSRDASAQTECSSWTRTGSCSRSRLPPGRR